MERQDDTGAEVDSAARAMDDDLREMEAHSEEVAEDIEEARSDWERKQQDSSIPGADTGGATEAEQVAGDWEGEAEGADEAGQ